MNIEDFKSAYWDSFMGDIDRQNNIHPSITTPDAWILIWDQVRRSLPADLEK